MKLIIDISEEIYKQIKGLNTIFRDDEKMCYEAVQNGTPLNEYIAEYIDKAFDDLNKCKCGSSYIVIDGEEYRTDIGYAFEGIELFMNYIKGTLSKEKWEE